MKKTGELKPEGKSFHPSNVYFLLKNLDQLINFGTSLRRNKKRELLQRFLTLSQASPLFEIILGQTYLILANFHLNVSLPGIMNTIILHQKLVKPIQMAFFFKDNRFEYLHAYVWTQNEKVEDLGFRTRSRLKKRRGGDRSSGVSRHLKVRGQLGGPRFF